MKRFHVHLHIADLDSSVRFYSALFGERPAVLKLDYAKWMLEDPQVNFAITSGAAKPTIDHLGFEVESDKDLATMAGRLVAAGQVVVRQDGAACCYARGNKRWVTDPSGVSWEAFHTIGDSALFGNDIAPKAAAAQPTQAESYGAPARGSSAACCAAKE